ncbi:MAG: NapC/NirT family cytochrome c [Acidobacteria bacterium]|nr:NapC/NirT family cytochrome c [Acidobacteriota bacterium]
MNGQTSIPDRLRAWLAPYVYFSNNWISLVGVVLVTSAAVLWLFMLPAAFGQESENPYLNIITVMALPATFFAGLILVPVGQLLRLRRERRAGRYPGRLPTLDLASPHLRRLLLFLIVTTVANLMIGGQLTYRSVHYMESVQFCGTTCHTVMKPEHTSYQNSPHSRVECVQCHIGPGASWAVRSKIDGIRQVWAVLVGDYSRPIPVPVKDLRPARETCEQCHWPQKFAYNKLRIIDKFADDEANTRSRTVLLMRLGGGTSGPHAHSGIHGAHLGPGVSIRYGHADTARQQIPRILYTNSNTGRSVEYIAADANRDAVRRLPTREMDCMDCHNRPTHAFDLPERAVDRALAEGLISMSLPFVKKQAVEILKQAYASEAEASAKIPAALDMYYRTGQPAVYARNAATVKQAGETLAAIWKRNVFPEMKVTWGTYPNNIGHTDFTGCFRCHDEKNVSVADQSVKMTQDCNTCHSLLAMEEPSPKILSELGIEEALPTEAAPVSDGAK